MNHPFLIRSGASVPDADKIQLTAGSLVLKPQDILVGSRGEAVVSTNKAAQGAERRKSARFAVSAAAEMLELHTRTRLNGRASDLGAGGCYIDTVSPFPRGTTLMLTLTSENRAFHAKASVVYALTGMGMGLTFTEMTAKQREDLGVWLRELNGELPGEQTIAEIDAQMPQVQEATVGKGGEGTGVLEALQELVSLLKNKRVLSEDEVELLRDKMAECRKKVPRLGR